LSLTSALFPTFWPLFGDFLEILPLLKSCDLCSQKNQAKKVEIKPKNQKNYQKKLQKLQKVLEKVGQFSESNARLSHAAQTNGPRKQRLFTLSALRAKPRQSEHVEGTKTNASINQA